MSNGLPVMLNIAARMCVVVGGGNVAARKITGLLEADASITLISPEIADSIKNLLQHIHWEQRPYKAGDLEAYHPALVYAATHDEVVNRQIAQEANALGVLVNVADELNESSFSNMITIRRSPLTIALHTGGTSPALAKHLGAVLDTAIGEEYAILAHWLGDLRTLSREQVDTQSQRQQLYEAVLTSDIPNLLRQQQVDTARQQFDALVRAWGVNI